MISLSEWAPAALHADKGRDANPIRTNLAKGKIEAVIPGRSNRRVKIEHKRTIYKERNRIERIFGHLKQSRHRDPIRSTGQQLPRHYPIATTRYWLEIGRAAWGRPLRYFFCAYERRECVFH